MTRCPFYFPLQLSTQLDTVIKLLPRLQYGLDVNVRFNNIRGFEFTEEMAAFDMSGVTLLHGWIVDPEDKRTVRVTLVTGRNSPVTPTETPFASHERACDQCSSNGSSS